MEENMSNSKKKDAYDKVNEARSNGLRAGGTIGAIGAGFGTFAGPIGTGVGAAIGGLIGIGITLAHGIKSSKES
jgi:hypothetical protein